MTTDDPQALRRRIDALDQAILELLAQRQHTAAAIGRLKAMEGWEIRDPQREADLLDDRAASASALGLDPDRIRSLWELVLDSSRAIQEDPDHQNP
jgi:chorismate mutase